MKMACYTHITSPAGGASSLSLVSPNWPTYSILLGQGGVREERHTGQPGERWNRRRRRRRRLKGSCFGGCADRCFGFGLRGAPPPLRSPPLLRSLLLIVETPPLSRLLAPLACELLRLRLGGALGPAVRVVLDDMRPAGRGEPAAVRRVPLARLAGRVARGDAARLRVRTASGSAAGGLLLGLLAARLTDGLHASGFRKTGRGASERHKDGPWLNKALFLEIRCFWLFFDSAGVGGVRRHLKTPHRTPTNAFGAQRGRKKEHSPMNSSRRLI